MTEFERIIRDLTAAGSVKYGAIPRALSAPGFSVPLSLRLPSASLEGWPFEKPATGCWECTAPLGPGYFGPYNFCDACRQAQRQEAREAARQPEEES